MPYLILGMLIIGAVIYSVIIKTKRLDPLDKLAAWPYEKKQQLLTPLELTFYQALCAHLQPGLTALVKVRLEDLIYVAQNSREKRRLHDKLAAYSLDFLICEAGTLRPVCALDFDDPIDEPSAMAPSETLVKILTAAHLHLFRFQPQYEYTQADFQPINNLFTCGNF